MDRPAPRPSKLRSLIFYDAQQSKNPVTQISTVTSTAGPATIPVTAADARDRFCYDEWCKGTVWREIREAVAEHPEWEPFFTDNGVKDAAKHYARKNKLPMPGSRPRRAPIRKYEVKTSYFSAIFPEKLSRYLCEW